MKLQPKDEPGELLYRFYKKWVTSFTATIFKAGITAGDKEIHEARVFLKKIFALLSFFEVLEASGFSQRKYIRLFKKIFLEAGKVREIQVNLELVNSYKQEYPEVSNGFYRQLKKDLKKTIRGLTLAIVGFPVHRLRPLDKAVKNFCRKLDMEIISSKSYEFLLTRALTIGFLSEHYKCQEDVHRIRKELKKMKAVASLLYQIESGKERSLLIKKLEKAEVMIGKWHDLVVFAEYIDRYRANMETSAGEKRESLLQVKERIATESSKKLSAVLPMISKISSGLFGNSLPGKSGRTSKNSNT